MGYGMDNPFAHNYFLKPLHCNRKHKPARRFKQHISHLVLKPKWST